MKTVINRPTEIDIKKIRIEAAVRYEDEDIPYDFPMRDGDMWIAEVDVDTGQIFNWPEGRSGVVHMKVCDCGTYRLFDADGKEVAAIEGDYVPNRVVPGQYGDYIDLQINGSGVITNWPKNPDFSDFFPY